MNWIERYVAEVKRYLPARNREDVGEELQSLLEEEVLAREADRERPLTAEETETFLRDFGHPMRVAARYGASGVLIGEALFPLYRKVVRYLLGAVLLVYVLAVLWNVVGGIIWGIAAEERLFNPGFGFGEAWSLAVNWLVFITLGFHLADRHLVRGGWLERWSPASLPPADAERESLLSCIVVCVLATAWLLLLNALSPAFSVPVLLGEDGNRLVTLLAWLKIQAVLVLAVYLVLVFRPYWSRGRRIAIMVSDLLTMVGVAICLGIGAEELLRHYPDLPEGLARGSTVVLWAWMLGLLVDLLTQGYRLLEGRGANRTPGDGF